MTLRIQFNIEVNIFYVYRNEMDRLKKRDNYIDIVKGWGIILVIWGHTSLFLFDEIYAFHMPLFFFLSGCFFSTKLDFVSFMKKKFRQLIIPYIFFLVLSCIYYWGLLFVTGRFDIYELLDIFQIFPYDNKILNAPLWFFYALFWMSLIYYLLRRYVRNDYLIFFIVLLMHIGEYLLSTNDISLPAYLGRSLREIIYMHMGFVLYNRTTLFEKIKIISLKNLFLLLISIVLFILLFSLQKKLDKDFTYSLLSIFTAFMGIAFSLYLCSIIRFKWIEKFFDYLGTHTLYLFSVHLPLYETSRPIAKRLFEKGSFQYDITSFLIVFALSIMTTEVLMLLFPKFLGRSLFAKKYN